MIIKVGKYDLKSIITYPIIAIFLLVFFMQAVGLLHYSNVTITMLILAYVSILFITEIIPLAVSAMSVPILLALLGILDVNKAFSGFSNSNVILFGSMFIVGGALLRSKVVKIIGDKLIRLANGNKSLLTLYILIITALLSSIMSNTGTVAVMIPVCVGIADAAKMDRKYLLLSLAYMSSLGGMITLVGTPPNITVASILTEFGYESFTFFEFAYIGIPMAIMGTIYLYLVTRRSYCNDDSKVILDVDEKEPINYKQVLSVIILMLVVFVMMSDIIDLALGAAIGALLCVLFNLETIQEAVSDIDWTTIFLFSGMLPLAQALEATKASKIIADYAFVLIGNNNSQIVILVVLFVVGTLLTQFMSNTAGCALLAPIGIEIANAIGANPKPVLLVIAIASASAFLTPMATPPNTLVMGHARAKFSDYIKLGLPLMVLSLIMCLIIIPQVWPFF